MSEDYNLHISKKALTAISIFTLTGTGLANYLVNKYSMIPENFNILEKIAAYTGVSAAGGLASFSTALLGVLKANNLVDKLKK